MALHKRRLYTKKLEAALAEAREATELKSRFLAAMSHEIRTPIHGILGMTELLLASRLDPEQREYADAVRRSTQTLLAIVNDILDLSKIEAGKLELENIAFDLWATVEEVAALVAFRAYAKNLELACYIHPDVPRLVRGDPARLRQVLTNLAGNAVKFTERGEVRIEAQLAGERKGGAEVRFAVSDTGIGITPDQRPRLFQAFSQGDRSTTRRYGGTGLGLTISRHLVERMGGEIGYDSEPGQGSTFRFTAVLRREGACPAAQQNPFSGAPALVVDANPTARMMVSRYLNSWGCRTAEAATAQEALELMRRQAGAGDPFRVALIDVRVAGPETAGFAQAVRDETLLRGTVLLGMGPVGMSTDGLRREGFAAFIAKPVRQSQLFGRVLEALDRAAPQQVKEKLPKLTSVEGKRVLVAEDNDINRKIVLRLLEKLGCQADPVSNGREALEAVQRDSYDLVLMDVQMPEMDGLAATGAIRGLEHGAARVPIAAMTANAMTGDRERCLAAGMDDYVSKPVRLDDLERMIGRWLS
ncbi:MAG: response regulator [Bryobacteraceae bacterium]